MASITPTADMLDIRTEPPNVEEVKKAIKAMKNGKAPSIDQVHVEMLKAEEHQTAIALTEILGKIWTSEETPQSWKTGLIVKLPKKGDLAN